MAKFGGTSPKRRQPAKVAAAIKILAAIGLPRAQQNERSALTLLALAGVGPRDPWATAGSSLLRTVDIIAFIRNRYQKTYAPNTRETIRRQTLHQFISAGLVERNPDAPERPTNSGLNRYALTQEVLQVLRAFGTNEFDDAIDRFLAAQQSLQDRVKRKRQAVGVPVTLPDGAVALLSAGSHNLLQKAIVEECGPRFAPGAAVVCLGDTAKKHAVLDAEYLARLGLRITEHDKLPDVLMYHEERGWLYVIEAVTSHGPLSPLRVEHLWRSIGQAKAGLVFVTAFRSRAEFRRFAADIAWETEVWIAEEPDHLIHFNGDRFLGPYQRRLTC